MNLYKEVPRFSERTGNPVKPDIERYAYICDYSGRLIDRYPSINYAINIEQISGCEPTFDSDELAMDFAEEYGIQMYGIFDSPYHFDDNGMGQDFTTNLMFEWCNNVNKKNHTFYECLSFDDLLRRSRMRILDVILRDKVYTLEQLGLEKE